MKKSLRTDQRGIAQVVVILLVLVVVGVAGFVGWRVMQNDKKPAAAKTTAGKAVNEACMKVYDDKNLCYAAIASSDLEKQPYKATATTTDPQGKTSTITLESDGKGNSSFTTKTEGQEYDTVMIGNTVYSKAAGASSWTKFASASTDTQATAANPSEDLKTTFSDANTPADKRIQYKNLGKEKCGSATCLKYQVIDPATPGATTYVWFNTKDYRLQRLQIKDSNGTTDFVITYTAVKIDTPSPVTDASAGAGVPTQAQIDAAMQQAQDAAAQNAQ